MQAPREPKRDVIQACMQNLKVSSIKESLERMEEEAMVKLELKARGTKVGV